MNSNTTSIIASAINAGQFLDAERLCRERLLHSPRDEGVLWLLATSLQGQQRWDEAKAIHAQLTEMAPAVAAHWINYGNVLQQVGQQDSAQAAYAKAIELEAGNIMARIQLGHLLIGSRDYLRARDVLLDAFEFDRQSPLVRIYAAKACCLCQDFEGAADLLKPWRHWLPLEDEAELELIKVLNQKNDALEAAWLLEGRVARRPHDLEAGIMLAAAYERFNRLDEASSLLASLLGTGVTLSPSQQNEVEHIRAALAFRRKDMAQARALLESAGPRNPEDAAHYFQLGSVCDKLGDVETAMQSLDEAHRRVAQVRQFDSPEYFAPGAPALLLNGAKVTREQFERWPQYVAPEAHDSPVFVVGFPRSGTTLLEQMLDAHPGLQSMDENPFFNYLADILRRHDPRILDDLTVLRQYDCDELRKRYNMLVAERIPRRWNALLVDKNPLNMRWLPLIYRLFPHARFILAIRHPCDVILSCYMQDFRSSGLAAACTSLERLARAYVDTMNAWLEDVSILAPTLMVSRYEELVTDFPQQVARIAEFLALPDPSAMQTFNQHALNKGYIGTPSYSQVVEPVNSKAMGRWLSYRRYFEPILPILEPMLRHWGYWIDEAV